MEVNVLRHGKFPEGSILSIRAGNVRRQAPVASGRPFKFPGKLENPLKVDIFQQVATGHVVMRPGEQQYKVVFLEDPSMHCELEVAPPELATRGSPARGSRGDDEDSPERTRRSESSAARGEASAASAKDYLEQHAILEFIQAVLQTVIRDKPADPFGAMARHFSSGYSGPEERERCEQMSPGRTMQSPRPLPPGRPLEMPPPPPAPSGQPPGMPPGAPTTEEWASLHSERARLTEERIEFEVAKAELAAERERLEESRRHPEITSRPSIEESTEDIRNALRGTLERSCESGHLCRALEVVKTKKPSNLQVHSEGDEAAKPEDTKMLLRDAFECAYESGLLQQVLESILQPAADSKKENALRGKIKQAFEQACETNDLDRVFSSIKPQLPRATDSGELGAATELEGIRQALRDDLQRSCASGSLFQALDTVKSTREDLEAADVEASREALKSLLVRTCDSGELVNALGAVSSRSRQKAGDTEDIRDALRDALERACTTGELGLALDSVTTSGRPQEPGLEDLRKKFRDAVQCNQGPGIEDLRVAFRDTLQRSCESGELSRALENAKAFEKSGASVKVEAFENSGASAKVDLMRSQMRAALEQSLQTGELDEVFSSLPRTKLVETAAGSQEDMRQVFRERLQRSCESGEFNKSVENVEARKTSSASQHSMLAAGIRAAMETGQQTGLLARALSAASDTQEEETADDIRQSLKQVLQRSVDSGALSQALEIVKSGNVRDQNDIDHARETLRNSPQASAFAIGAHVEVQFSSETELNGVRGKVARIHEVLPGENVERVVVKLSGGAGERLLKPSNLKLVQKRAQVAEETAEDEMRKQLKDLLQESYSSGQLGEALEYAKSRSKLNELRLSVGQLLSRANEAGDLRAALRAVQDTTAPMAPPQENLDDLRNTLRGTLQRAGESGELCRVLQSVKDPPLPPEELDKARIHIKNSLVQACSAGTLESALRSMPTAFPDTMQVYPDLRRVLKESLVKSYESGELSEVVSGFQQRQLAQELKPKIRGALEASLLSGELQQVLSAFHTKSRASDVEQVLRPKIREALESSLRAGELDQILATKKVRTPDTEASRLKDLAAARRQVKDVLLDSLSSGKLQKALTELVPQMQSPMAAQDPEEMRSTVRSIFEEAYDSGRLAEALQRVTVPSTMMGEDQAAKGRMRDLFAQASTNGELEQALDTLREERGPKGGRQPPWTANPRLV